MVQGLVATSVRMHDDDVSKTTDKGNGKANMMSAIVVPALEDATHQRPPTMTKTRKGSYVLYRASTTSFNDSSKALASTSSSLCTCWSRQVSFLTRHGGSAAGAPPKPGTANRFPREGAYRYSADQHDADPDPEERADGDDNDDDDESDDNEPAFTLTTTPSRPTTGPTTRRIRSGYDTRLGH